MKVIMAILIVGLFVLCGCTEQIRAKSFGGNSTIILPLGQKVVNATWKDSNLWILTRQMGIHDEAWEYNLQEFSSWGLLQGAVKIIEKDINNKTVKCKYDVNKKLECEEK